MIDFPAPSVNVPVVLGVVPQLKTCGLALLTAQEMPVGIVLPAASSDQVTPDADGKLSVSVTPVASPAPVLLSVTVKPIDSPALTVPLSAVLVIDRFGQLTVVDAVGVVPLPSLPVLNVAVLLYVPQLPEVVPLTTCSTNVFPAPSVNEPVVLGDVPQLNTCGVAFVIPHEMPVGIEVPPEALLSIDQLIPVPPGRVSDNVTPVASPAPLLASVIM